MITDSARIDPLEGAKNLPSNSGIILRDYDLGFDDRLKLGLQLKKICRQKNMPLLIAKDSKLARVLKADGMHFPEFMLAYARRLKSQRPDWLITIAAHSKKKVIAVYNANLDAVLVSPVYETDSHPGKKPLGSQRAGLYIYKDMPAYPLGGVMISDKKILQNKGFYGITGIGWVPACVESATVPR